MSLTGQLSNICCINILSLGVHSGVVKDDNYLHQDHPVVYADDGEGSRAGQRVTGGDEDHSDRCPEGKYRGPCHTWQDPHLCAEAVRSVGQHSVHRCQSTRQHWRSGQHRWVCVTLQPSGQVPCRRAMFVFVLPVQTVFYMTRSV